MDSVTTVGPSVELTLSGRSISPGLAMGPAWVVGDLLKCTGSAASITEGEVADELARLTRSFEETLAELDEYARRIEAEFDSTLAGIFRVHGQMLRELFASGEFQRELRGSLQSAEVAVRRVLMRWYEKFQGLSDQTFRQRADDVLDLGRGIIRRLRGHEQASFAGMPESSVLVIEQLLPSDVVALGKSKVAAVVVEKLAQGSHAALLAREKNIPTIAELPTVLAQVTGGTELLVDGFRGTLVVAPDAAKRADFQARFEKWRASLVRCKSACRDPARTLDGQQIDVSANIGVVDDVDLAIDNGADGVGLLRLEQLYFGRPAPPSEPELLADLKNMLAPLDSRLVVIRLLDIGGDKPLPYLSQAATANPALGLRGVRLLLHYPQLLRTQLGALLQLSQQQRLRVLVPMITLADDIRHVRETLDALVRERGLSKSPELGAMIETPAAALSISALKQYADFFSVGTNDLTQYTLAVARDDASVSDYYVDSHESVLRLLSFILAEAGERPVSLCGELAGREAYLPRLLNMGVRSVSIAPAAIPTTKALIRTLRLGQERV